MALRVSGAFLPGTRRFPMREPRRSFAKAPTVPTKLVSLVRRSARERALSRSGSGATASPRSPAARARNARPQSSGRRQAASSRGSAASAPPCAALACCICASAAFSPSRGLCGGFSSCLVSSAAARTRALARPLPRPLAREDLRPLLRPLMVPENKASKPLAAPGLYKAGLSMATVTSPRQDPLRPVIGSAQRLRTSPPPHATHP